jgi:hypothetical protein
MKKIITLFVPALFLAIIFIGCSKGNKPIEIKDLVKYQDEVTKGEVLYPSNWYLAQKRPGERFLVFSEKAHMDRFRSYSGEGLPGAKVELLFMKLDQTNTLDSVIKKMMKFTPETYSQPEKVTIDGIQATRIFYAFELNDGKFDGEMYFAAKDPEMATILILEAFGDGFKEYKDQFKQIASKLVLGVTPKVKVDTIRTEEPPASQTLTQKSGKGYSIMIPDNFNSTSSKMPGTLYSANYIGKRRADCNIQVDVYDASKQKNLKKIVDDNSATYKNATPNKISLSGAEAYFMNYSPAKGVKSKVYFTLKGDKFFKITVNWFANEEADYLPVFDKCVAAFKFE